ncbi:MAG: isopentenyl-diphosphate Delta-isomerase [Planctomycetes bacterium]|nr:isopentenyl-diphosphate Delta-isomerase [Planctomycetota bacterium]
MATVILTDSNGVATGVADAVDAHSGEGRLHKAFSVYVFRNGGQELLIQQRSRHKRLWPLVWANTCCSHPREGEDVVAAGQRRLKDECGFTSTLIEHGSFVYRAEDPSGRGVEHEHVTILIGQADEEATCRANAMEIADWRWVPLEELRKDMQRRPQEYAPWFHLGMERIGWDRSQAAGPAVRDTGAPGSSY